MNLKQSVGARWHETANAGGQEVGNIPGRPAAEVTLDLDSSSRIGSVSRPRLGGIALPPRARAIQKRHDMMHDTPVARPVFNGGDVGVPPQVGGDDEATVNIRSRCRDWEVLGHLDHQVGSSQRPPVRECGCSGAVFLLAAQCACLCPGVQNGDGFPGKRRIVLELRPEPRDRLPWRHRPVPRNRGDIQGPLSSLFVSVECERPYVVASMAVLAALLQDRQHILGVSWRRPFPHGLLTAYRRCEDRHRADTKRKPSGPGGPKGPLDGSRIHTDAVLGRRKARCKSRAGEIAWSRKQRAAPGLPLLPTRGRERNVNRPRTSTFLQQAEATAEFSSMPGKHFKRATGYDNGVRSVRLLRSLPGFPACENVVYRFGESKEYTDNINIPSEKQVLGFFFLILLPIAEPMETGLRA